MGTRRPGTMRERPAGSGRWQLRVFIGADPTTGKPRQIAKSFTGGERAAAKELAKMVADVDAGRFDSSRATVGDLLDRWLEQITPTRSPKTVAEYSGKIERHIRPALGHLRLNKLGADTLDAWYAKWQSSGLSDSTVHHLHSILSAALNQAEKWGWINSSPARRASPPAQRSPIFDVPTPERLIELVRTAQVADPVLGTAVALAALTGARRGELCALRWSDVDSELGRIRICRSFGIVNGVTHEGPTKTHANRDIALDELGIEVLRERWAYMQDLSDRASSPLVADPFVLTYDAHGGNPAAPNTITRRFADLCRKLEVEAQAKAKRAGRELRADELWPYRFHDLRHFSVTTLIAAGVDIRTVAERHGHSQATMTLNRYAHALPERDRDAAGVLGRALTPG